MYDIQNSRQQTQIIIDAYIDKQISVDRHRCVTLQHIKIIMFYLFNTDIMRRVSVHNRHISTSVIIIIKIKIINYDDALGYCYFHAGADAGLE